jgi:molecular chaperone DnaJ
MDFNKNYYEILGVEKTATITEIKKVFRKKANETHPDKHGGDDSEFKEINEAYQILGNEQKRQQYDTMSPHGSSYNPMGGGFNTIFEFFTGGGQGQGGFDPFSAFFGGNRGGGYKENLDINISVDISLKDVYNNESIDVEYERNVECDGCKGTGFDPDSESHECSVCDGEGKVWEPMFGFVKCKYCKGTGKIHTGTCTKCNGEKVVKKKEKFQLNNIYRTRSSDVKYIRGYGHISKYYEGKAGSLILSINYRHDNRYEIKNGGLYYNLDVHFEDAINGVDIKYEHLDNKTYDIVIPPMTKDKDKIKMKGLGMLNNPKDRQDLIVNINIVIDYDKLNV